MGARRPLGRCRGSQARPQRGDRAGEGNGLTLGVLSAMVAAAQNRSGAMSNQDRIYFARRAAEEQDRAVASEDPNVADTHPKLQRAYLDRASTGARPANQSQPVG